MHLNDRTLEKHLTGSLWLPSRLLVSFHLALCQNCRTRLTEIESNLKMEAELREAIDSLPDPGPPPKELSQRLSACIGCGDGQS